MNSLPKRNVSCHELADLISDDLSARFLADRSVVLKRLRAITTRRGRWIDQLAAAIHSRYQVAGHARRNELRIWLSDHPTLKQGFRGAKRMLIASTTFQDAIVADYRWKVPEANDDSQLRDLLCLRSAAALHWLETPHIRRDTKVDHYQRRLHRSSGGRQRWIEQPRPLMKRVQRLILREILQLIPLHEAAHAYRTGRSVRSCASQHVGKRVVLKMDLQNFFGNIPLRRVASLFHHAGYPYPIALTLARICTAPAIADSDPKGPLHQTRLAQGAPTSPAIANAIAYQFDRRLAGLASSLNVGYTRYADDVVFSGDRSFATIVDRFATTVAVIATEEGFQVQHRKTRKMFSGERQRVLGLNVNEKLNTDRKQYEQLKAILTNCIRHGWESQNRDAHPNFREHLRGCIGYTGQTNPNRYAKLIKLFDEIQW